MKKENTTKLPPLHKAEKRMTSYDEMMKAANAASSALAIAINSRPSKPPRTLKSISVKSAGFVKLLKNQDKEIRWQCKGLNGEILSGCEYMKRKADVLQNMILTHKLLGVMIKELKKV